MIEVVQDIILHIPHSSTIIPYKEGYVLEEQDLENDMNLLTDWFTDDLFDLPYPKIITPFSRIFCDVERFADDEKEIMGQYGMGMLYTHLDNGKLMRKVNHDLRMKIKSDYYDVHHRMLESLTSEMMARYGKSKIIDCHSYEDKPNHRDLNKDIPRPDFCIGADDYHTPDNLTQRVKNYLTKQGYKVEINKPYSGTIIPMKYYKQERNIAGIMIEVNRKLYMTKMGNTNLKNADFDTIKALMKEIVIEINKY